MSKFIFVCIFLFFLFCGCKKDDSFSPLLTEKYTNEFFYLKYPKDWDYDNSQWNTREGIQSKVFFFPVLKPGQKREKENMTQWIDCSEEFVRMRLESSKEAAVLYTILHPLKQDSTYIRTIYEEDSLIISGIYSYLLVHERKIYNDTVIQKQYIVLKKESGRIYYFNNFYLKSLEDKYEPLGDSVIYSIKFHF